MPRDWSLPLAKFIRRARIVLEHQSAAVHARKVFTPAKVGVTLFVLGTAAALLLVKMHALIVQIYTPVTAIAPDDGLARRVNVDLN